MCSHTVKQQAGGQRGQVFIYGHRVPYQCLTDLNMTHSPFISTTVEMSVHGQLLCLYGSSSTTPVSYTGQAPTTLLLPDHERLSTGHWACTYQCRSLILASFGLTDCTQMKSTARAFVSLLFYLCPNKSAGKSSGGSLSMLTTNEATCFPRCFCVAQCCARACEKVFFICQWGKVLIDRIHSVHAAVHSYWLLSHEADFKKFHQGFLYVSNCSRQF